MPFGRKTKKYGQGGQLVEGEIPKLAPWTTFPQGLMEATNAWSEQAPGVVSSAWQQVVSAIRDEDKTPLVRLLLEVIEEQSQRLEEQARRIEEQAQRIAALEAEIARLKGPKKPASNSKPSALSKPAAAPSPDGKRPGSEKRSKTKDLPIHEEIPLPPKELPPGATLLTS